MGNIVNNPSRFSRMMICNRNQKISEKERMIFAFHVLRYMKDKNMNIDAGIMSILNNMDYDDFDIYYIIFEHFYEMSSDVFRELISSLKLFQPFRLAHISYVYISTQNDCAMQCEKIKSVFEPFHLLYLYMNGFDIYEEYMNLYQVDFDIDNLHVLISTEHLRIHDNINELLIPNDEILKFVEFLVITENPLLNSIIYDILDVVPNFVVEFFKILINNNSIVFLKKYCEIFYGYNISHFLRNASVSFLFCFIEHVSGNKRPNGSAINRVWQGISGWTHYEMSKEIANHYAGMYRRLGEYHLPGNLTFWYYIKPAFDKFLCTELLPLNEAKRIDVENLFKDANYIPLCLCNIIFHYIGHLKYLGHNDLLKFCS
jgi:hypothetical protein